MCSSENWVCKKKYISKLTDHINNTITTSPFKHTHKTFLILMHIQKLKYIICKKYVNNNSILAIKLDCLL